MTASTTTSLTTSWVTTTTLCIPPSAGAAGEIVKTCTFTTPPTAPPGGGQPVIIEGTIAEIVDHVGTGTSSQFIRIHDQQVMTASIDRGAVVFDEHDDKWQVGMRVRVVAIWGVPGADDHRPVLTFTLACDRCGVEVLDA